MTGRPELFTSIFVIKCPPRVPRGNRPFGTWKPVACAGRYLSSCLASFSSVREASGSDQGWRYGSWNPERETIYNLRFHFLSCNILPLTRKLFRTKNCFSQKQYETWPSAKDGLAKMLSCNPKQPPVLFIQFSSQYRLTENLRRLSRKRRKESRWIWPVRTCGVTTEALEM